MSKKLDIRIATTSHGRAEIAAQIAVSFYNHIRGAALSQVTLAIGSSDSELGGASSPIVVGRKKYHFGFSNPAGLARVHDLSDGRGYRYAPSSLIPVDHLDRKTMTMEEFCRGGDGGPLTIPLHPGAKRYYQEKGYL